MHEMPQFPLFTATRWLPSLPPCTTLYLWGLHITGSNGPLHVSNIILHTAVFPGITITGCVWKEIPMGEVQDLHCFKIKLHELKEQMTFSRCFSAIQRYMALFDTLPHTRAPIFAHNFDMAMP